MAQGDVRRTTSSRAGRGRTPSGTKPQESVGGTLERRVARIEFAQGALVRLRVPVTTDAADPKRGVLTDIDILAVDVDYRYRLSRSSAECKSGQGQTGEVSTLIWLAGFREFLRLDRAVLVRPAVSSRGQLLARRLRLETLDETTLSRREQEHAWLPERFAHVDGPANVAAEARTDVQLKGLPDIPTAALTFLRGEALLGEPFAILNAVAALGRGVQAQGVAPNPAGLVIAGHCLIGLLLAGIQQAAELDVISISTLRRRLELALTVGSPDDAHLLQVLGKADALFQYVVRKTHEAYVAGGAEPLPAEVPSLRDVIARPPDWVDAYVALVERLRGNPHVARDLLQTAELICFDALLGDTAWRSPAFQHLMTPEHRGLLLAAVAALREVTGALVADSLSGIASLSFPQAVTGVPERRTPPSDEDGMAPERGAPSEAHRAAVPEVGGFASAGRAKKALSDPAEGSSSSVVDDAATDRTRSAERDVPATDAAPVDRAADGGHEGQMTIQEG